MWGQALPLSPGSVANGSESWWMDHWLSLQSVRTGRRVGENGLKVAEQGEENDPRSVAGLTRDEEGRSRWGSEGCVFCFM